MVVAAIAGEDECSERVSQPLRFDQVNFSLQKPKVERWPLCYCAFTEDYHTSASEVLTRLAGQPRVCSYCATMLAEHEEAKVSYCGTSYHADRDVNLDSQGSKSTIRPPGVRKSATYARVLCQVHGSGN